MIDHNTFASPKSSPKIKFELNPSHLPSKPEIHQVLTYLERLPVGDSYRGRLNLSRRLAIELGIFCGLRCCEIVSLRQADVLDGARFTSFFLPTKTKKNSTMPAVMNSRIESLIRQAQAIYDSPYCLGRRYDRSWPWRIWVALQVLLWGQHRYRFHDLRHFSISSYYDATRDILQTRMFGRHKSIQSTEIYVKLFQQQEVSQNAERIAMSFRPGLAAVGGGR